MEYDQFHYGRADGRHEYHRIRCNFEVIQMQLEINDFGHNDACGNREPEYRV